MLEYKNMEHDGVEIFQNMTDTLHTLPYVVGPLTGKELIST